MASFAQKACFSLKIVALTIVYFLLVINIDDDQVSLFTFRHLFLKSNVIPLNHFVC